MCTMISIVASRSLLFHWYPIWSNQGPGLRFKNKANVKSLIPKMRGGKAVKVYIHLVIFTLEAKR